MGISTMEVLLSRVRQVFRMLRNLWTMNNNEFSPVDISCVATKNKYRHVASKLALEALAQPRGGDYQRLCIQNVRERL